METAAGTQAVKLHVHPQDRRDLVGQVVRRVESARQAIGPDRELMIDAWMEWDVDTTLAIAERIRPLGIDWIEEPLSADDLAGYAELCRHSPIPIAGGEHEFTAIGFGELIERRLHQVLQPDACWCGGMTEMVKIYRMARSAGLRVVPHRGAEVWGLHAIAALDSEPLAESGRPWMTWVRGQPEIEQGVIRLGTSPGFGVELNERAVQQGS
jgi:L-rhamnonate dehydratase